MKFIVERNWIECIGHMWMPDTIAAKCIDLRAYDIENITAYARELFDSETITREAIDRWLSLNEGDFQGVEDFHAVIGEQTFEWKDDENEFVYHDCMFPSED